MYCWIEPPSGYNICIHTSFGGYAEGFALVAKPKMREVLQLSAPDVVFGLSYGRILGRICC